jgi:hypothetical protein
MVTFVVEASHLFRAGDKHQTQFYVLDVVKKEMFKRAIAEGRQSVI